MAPNGREVCLCRHTNESWSRYLGPLQRSPRVKGFVHDIDARALLGDGPKRHAGIEREAHGLCIERLGGQREFMPGAI